MTTSSAPSDLFKMTHDFSPSGEMLEHFAKTLIITCGADGEISEPEWAALTALGQGYGLGPEALVALRGWDYRGARLEDFAPALKDARVARGIVYEAVRLASADAYHEKERAAVGQLAGLLEVDAGTVRAIEALVETEAGLRRTRLALLYPHRQ